MELYTFNSEKLDYQRLNKYLLRLKWVGIGVLVSAIVISLSSFQYIKQEKVRYVESEEVINLVTNNSFSLSAFKKEVYQSNFKFPDIIIAQAYIESQHFSSPVWLENHNMFGMKVAKSRFTLAIDDNLNHAVFKNWKDCVKDRLIYDALYVNNLTRAQYLGFLDKRYARAGGTNYSKLINQVIRSKNIKNGEVQVN